MDILYAILIVGTLILLFLTGNIVLIVGINDKEIFQETDTRVFVFAVVVADLILLFLLLKKSVFP